MRESVREGGGAGMCLRPPAWACHALELRQARSVNQAPVLLTPSSAAEAIRAGG